MKIHLSALLAISICSNLLSHELSIVNSKKLVGVFTQSDPILPGITFGNWGSRPYEYAWAASLVSVENKKVIDLGVGLPSQYNWYEYVVNSLKPSFYVGIDYDGRMEKEIIKKDTYEMLHMNMADIKFPDKSFDIAYCISTYEHITYDIFIKAMQETHRVLKDDGILIITLDEEWDKDEPANHGNGWNLLEQSLITSGKFTREHRSFGLPEFMSLIKDYFVLYLDDAVVDGSVIRSKNGSTIYYDRKNKDSAILNSGSAVNSCVSYAVLKKK
jgi:SAM-dependent methyltransferase